MNTQPSVCPRCGQIIPATAPRQGDTIFCPSCRQPITIAPLDAIPPLRQPPVAPRMPPAVGGATGPTNGLAIASLALSVASVVVPLAFVPGIICGHVARSQIRRHPGTTGSGLALAGLLVGYAMMALTVVVVLVILAILAFQRSQMRPEFRPGGPPPMVMPGNRGGGRGARPVVVPMNQTLRVDAVNNPIAGSIEGSPFRCREATLNTQSGILTLRQEQPVQDIVIFLFLSNGESAANRQWNVSLTGEAAGTKPHVHFGWKEGNADKRRALADGYELQLQFGAQSGDEIPGRLTLRIPGEPGTQVKGDFTATVK